jgi:hypothetical protein
MVPRNSYDLDLHSGRGKIEFLGTRNRAAAFEQAVALAAGYARPAYQQVCGV